MGKGSHELTTELLTVSEAAAYLKCSREFIWKLRKKGDIETVHAGNKVLLPKSSIDNFLKLKEDVNKRKTDIVKTVNEAVSYAIANGTFTPSPLLKETIETLNRCAKLVQEKKLVFGLPQSTIDALTAQAEQYIKQGGNNGK